VVVKIFNRGLEMSDTVEGDWPEDCSVESEQDRMLRKVSAVIRKLLLEQIPSISESVDEIIGDLENAADEIDGMFESNDPRSTGWVGDDGLP
jgi:hypothetical protein